MLYLLWLILRIVYSGTTYHEPCKYEAVYTSAPQVQDRVIGPSFSRSVLNEREALPVLLGCKDLVEATDTRDPFLADIS